MTHLDKYELRPLRSGQICVAPTREEPLVAYRSVLATAHSLEWTAVEPDSRTALAAVAGYRAYWGHVAATLGHWRFAMSPRQLAQMCAGRCVVMALAAPEDNLETLAASALQSVLMTTLGDDVIYALEQLPEIGLDIGCTRERRALQIVINLAEADGASAMLDYLSIEPWAANGVVHASDWLSYFATPKILNGISDMAVTDDVARELLTYRRQTHLSTGTNQ